MSGTYLGMPPFPKAARSVHQGRAAARATYAAPPTPSATSGRTPSPSWTTGQQLREAGRQIKDRTLRHLDEYLVQTRGGGHRGRRARALGHRRRRGQPDRHRPGQAPPARREVVKVKSMATQEIGLNEALAAEGITAYETDLAELIVQLGDDLPSHILVPAIHKNRAEIRDIFRARWPLGPAGAERADRRARRARRGRAPAPAREVPAREGRRLRRQLRWSPRPARSSSSNPRATAGCA